MSNFSENRPERRPSVRQKVTLLIFNAFYAKKIFAAFSSYRHRLVDSAPREDRERRCARLKSYRHQHSTDPAVTPSASATTAEPEVLEPRHHVRTYFRGPPSKRQESYCSYENTAADVRLGAP